MLSHIIVTGAANGGAVSLTPCGPGTYSRNDGSVRCEKCQPGSFSAGDNNQVVRQTNKQPTNQPTDCESKQRASGCALAHICTCSHPSIGITHCSAHNAAMARLPRSTAARNAHHAAHKHPATRSECHASHHACLSTRIVSMISILLRMCSAAAAATTATATAAH